MKILKPTLLMLFISSMVSCEKNKVGVYEQHGISNNSTCYVCYAEESDYLPETDTRKYWPNKKCSDLGYTKRALVQSGDNEFWYFINPDGENYPGDYGYFKENESSSSGGCANENYEGPEFNIQIDSQCKAAHVYTCSGNQDGVTVACALYKQYQDQDPSIPDCPYCP